MVKFKLIIICVVIIIIVLGGFVIFIVWLVDCMKLLLFIIDIVFVIGYNFIFDNCFNVIFNFVIWVYNCDFKYIIKYRVIVVLVYYNGYILVYQILVLFVQDYGEDVIFDVVFIVCNVIIVDDDVVGDLRNGIRNGNGNGQMIVEVRVRVVVRFEVVRWKYWSYILKIICLNVVINFVNGKIFQFIKCDVDWF